jgi:predicted PolB exonuclease-like 3'-5' exonuclease
MGRVQGSIQRASHTDRHYGRKLNEFLALAQGNRTVLQYAQAFNDLCQYAGYHADTDEKKRDGFRRGLSTKLRDCLNTVRANSYNELVNMAIS